MNQQEIEQHIQKILKERPIAIEYVKMNFSTTLQKAIKSLLRKNKIKRNGKFYYLAG